jgi:prolyl-tRNA editing enzyme YbaK/EbsC (Cys-tRNA(Pro) deacylase)
MRAEARLRALQDHKEESASMEAAGRRARRDAGAETLRPPDRILTSYLETHDVPYRYVEGRRRFTPEDGEAADGALGACSAVLLRTRRGWRLAVIPADERLDLVKARAALREPGLRLASESESGALFPEFEAGRVPPIGPHYPYPDLLDERLLAHEEVLCETGLTEQRLAIDPQAIVRLAGAAVADVCQA